MKDQRLQAFRTAVDSLGESLEALFQGTPTDTLKVSAMCAAMERLDAAYVVYRKRVTDSRAEKLDAASVLELEISETMVSRPSAV
jgi:hypothetical protein